METEVQGWRETCRSFHKLLVLRSRRSKRETSRSFESSAASRSFESSAASRSFESSAASRSFESSVFLVAAKIKLQDS
jgi:hypothetical protein